ncbi:Aspartate--tRNA ligase, mitochondrial-like [Balamuthia mandrillaris]
MKSVSGVVRGPGLHCVPPTSRPLLLLPLSPPTKPLSSLSPILSIQKLRRLPPLFSSPSNFNRSFSSSSSSSASLSSPQRTAPTEGKEEAELLRRTHRCGQLRESDIGRCVSLCGWLSIKRNFGPLLFLVLSDATGSVQVCIDEDNPWLSQEKKEEIASNQKVHVESILSIKGVVRARPVNMKNENMQTGAIEVELEELHVLNPSIERIPFSTIWEDKTTKEKGQEGSGEEEVVSAVAAAERMQTEELRLRYRYLELRRPHLQHNLKTRSQVSLAIRNFLHTEGFTEVETPTLFRSTPEGAREFLVPTRNKGRFYSLPQSPQQYKQLLMAGGIDRYFQLARCYRDEGLRSDRQPEFTQVDMELSFVTAKDVQSVIERMLQCVWKKALNQDIHLPFPRMTHNDAMLYYGSDKPDMRYDMKLTDVSHVFRTGGGVRVFEEMLKKKGGCVKGIKLEMKKTMDLNKSELEMLKRKAEELGIPEITKIRIQGTTKWESPLAKHMTPEAKQRLLSAFSLDQQPEEESSILLLAAHPTSEEKVCKVLGALRVLSAQILQQRGLLHLPKDQFNFLWVEDFPLFTLEEEEGEEGKLKVTTTHHPFTAPRAEDLPLLQKLEENRSNEEEYYSILREIRGQHYDVVLNGVELGGGSIRIHNAALQKQVFELLGFSDDLKSRFRHLTDALSMGCPPHGGIALGFDRLMAILCGAKSLREVIAFPKTVTGNELMSGAPSEVSAEELAEYHLRLAPDGADDDDDDALAKANNI